MVEMKKLRNDGGEALRKADKHQGSVDAPAKTLIVLGVKAAASAPATTSVFGQWLGNFVWLA